MKKIVLFIIHCSLFIALCSLPLYASGKTETTEVPVLNNQWVLLITAFDYSLLPSGRHITGDVIARELTDRLKTINYRLRISPEYAFYESHAWQESIRSASRSISQKQDERALLLFRGETDRRYQTNLNRIDADLERLWENLWALESQRPLINTEPEFTLSPTNVGGTFPAVPRAATEHRFLQSQRADAFLTGEIRQFHGRYFIRLRLFTLYTNSFVYEDDIIFSLEDMTGAIDEIATRLTAVISGTRPAAITVQADPPESQILINQSFAGRGTVSARERPPGMITIAVAAEGYNPMTIETELVSGELTEVAVSLGPQLFSEVTIDSAQAQSASVYHGALYVGSSPLTLRLPIEQLNYVLIETAGGEQGRAVFTSPDMPGESISLSLAVRMPPNPAERRVNRARRRSYWAWGTVWITGITAWVTNGIYSSQLAVLPNSSSGEFFQSTQTMYYVSTGALAAFGVAIINYFIQMPRYLYTASQGATPVVR